MSLDKKELKVEKGNGNNLEISPVYEHLNAVKPKTEKKSKNPIIIPKQEKK